MFLGCLYYAEFYLNIQGTGPFIFAVQYKSIFLHIFTRYISVASRPGLHILKLFFFLSGICVVISLQFDLTYKI